MAQAGRESNTPTPMFGGAELFPASVEPDVFSSSRFRIVRVQGDHMSPGLRHNRDFVLAVPVNSYSGPGRYVLQWDGLMVVYDCEKRISGADVWLACSSPYYTGQLISLAGFNDAVVAKVGADIIVRDESVLQGAA